MIISFFSRIFSSLLSSSFLSSPPQLLLLGFFRPSDLIPWVCYKYLCSSNFTHPNRPLPLNPHQYRVPKRITNPSFLHYLDEMMQNLHRTLSRFTISPIIRSLIDTPSKDAVITSNKSLFIPLSWRNFSTNDDGNENDPWRKPWGNTGYSSAPVGCNNDWDSAPSWSTGITKEHFHGEAVGHQVTDETVSAKPTPSVSSSSLSTVAEEDSYDDIADLIGKERRKSEAFVRGWGQRMKETTQLLKQVMEPGVRGSYLKNSEKAEMYRLHKMNPDVYTIEKLGKDYRVMRQRVHAILWLKEDEEEQEKKLGKPLDDSVEMLLDSFPEFFNSHCREFHVAKLPYKPNFKVMLGGCEGTARDPDEVHYEISMKEDEMLYEEFVQRMNFNKKKIAGEVKCHKYSRRRSDDGWRFTIAVSFSFCMKEMLDLQTRVKICIGIARGLAFLHEGAAFRIVHRDIKFSNVLLDKDLNPISYGITT